MDVVQADALRVITTDPKIRAFLEANDPKALEQAEHALSVTDDDVLALWFSPQAIRDHFEADDDYLANAVRTASDDDLRKVGEWCIGSDSLYREFHRLLVSAVRIEIMGERW